MQVADFGGTVVQRATVVQSPTRSKKVSLIPQSFHSALWNFHNPLCFYATDIAVRKGGKLIRLPMKARRSACFRAFWYGLRDQEVAGSNPVSPTYISLRVPFLIGNKGFLGTFRTTHHPIGVLLRQPAANDLPI